MLNKKLKVILSLFVALIVMATMCFATNETPATTSEETVTATEATSEETKETTEATSEETEDATEATSETPETSEGTEATGNEELSEQPKATEGDVYKASTNIELTEAINGNVFLVGSTVKVTGQIAGDLFVVAEELNLDGAQIYGNVFAIANTINLNGLIYDLYGACNTLTVPYNGTAYRDLKVVCQNATINGVVGGNLKIAVSDNLTLEDDCMVYKNLEYTSPNKIEVKEGVVQGEVKYSAEETSKPNVALNYLMSFACVLVFTLVVWLIVTFLAPKFNEKLVACGKTRPIASILYGLLGVILIPIVAVLLCVTVVGVPIAIALCTTFALALSISLALAIISLSDILAKKVSVLSKGKNVLAVLVTSLVIWLLTLIPVISGIVTILAVLYGFGMLILTVLNKTEKKVKAEKTESK